MKTTIQPKLHDAEIANQPNKSGLKSLYKKIFWRFLLIVLFLTLFLAVAFIRDSQKSFKNDKGWVIEMLNMNGEWEKMMTVHGYSRSFGIDHNYTTACKIADYMHRMYNRIYRVSSINKQSYIPQQMFDGKSSLSKLEKITILEECHKKLDALAQQVSSERYEVNWRSTQIFIDLKLANKEWVNAKNDLDEIITSISKVIYAPYEGADPENFILNAWVETSHLPSVAICPKDDAIENIQYYKKFLINLIRDMKKQS
ncbi:MAG: hypothetical protein RLZ22_13 [Verrucomicrobiota bacterium]|jgi:hypothetical protein